VGQIASPVKIPDNSTLHGLREQIPPLIQDPASSTLKELFHD
jgi:hypothetical protein